MQNRRFWRTRTACVVVLLHCSPIFPQREEPLSLEGAIATALEHNRQLKSSRLEVAKVGDRIAATRTRRLPQFSLYTLGNQRLTVLDFKFDQGAFGVYPGLGPIPAENTSIRSPRQFSMLVIGQVSQPLSQQYKISLGLKQLGLEREAMTEAERIKRAAIINEVKQSYYAIVQAQTALEAVEESIRLYREMDRITEQYVLQQVALKADNLDVKARLAKAEYDAMTIRNPLAAQKERLNLLLGRDLNTGFSPVAVEEARWSGAELPELQRTALEKRPELKQARLRVRQADYDRRIAKSEYIPEVSLTFSYLSPMNYGSLIPANIAGAGVTLQWDIFDWGRRRHTIAEKARTTEQASLQVTEAENQVLLEVNARYRSVQEAQQLLTVARMGREVAQERLRVTTNRYRQEAALLKDVLQHQTSVAEATSQFSRALAAFWTAAAELEKAVGDLP